MFTAVTILLFLQLGQAYTYFRQYIKEHESPGVILTVCSKNDEENAYAGLNHPNNILKPSDFAVIAANWENKDQNIRHIAQILNIGNDSLIFADDNPVERHIVKSQIPAVSVPEMIKPEKYIQILDKNAYFESPALTNDDFKRGEMYKTNAQRVNLQKSFSNYKEFLISLEMHAEINNFRQVYFSRISQLSNKSNQFNLSETTELLNIGGLVELKNTLLQQGRYTDPVDKLIFKVTTARAKRVEIERITDTI